MLDRLRGALIARLPVRFSEKPAKMLLWFWLSSDLRRIGHQSFAIDAACGEMKNRRFFDVDPSSALAIVRDPALATADGGSLLVNFGSRGTPLPDLERAALEVLGPRFERIDVRRYGALLDSVPFGLALSPLLALGMWALPLRHAFGRHYHKLYLVCSGRRDATAA